LQYATESQIHFHGFDPKESLVKIAPRPGEYTIRHEDIVAKIKEGGFALIMLPGVQFSSGQYFDLKAITEVGHDNVRSPTHQRQRRE
jgi:kynureninase